MPHTHTLRFHFHVEPCAVYDAVVVGGSVASLWGKEKSAVTVKTVEVRGTVEKSRGRDCSILKEVKSK